MNIKEKLNKLPARKILIITSRYLGYNNIDNKSILINRIMRCLESETTPKNEADIIFELIESFFPKEQNFKNGDVVFYRDQDCFCRVTYISASKTHVDLQVLSVNKSNSRRMLDKYFNIPLLALVPLRDYFLNRDVFYNIGGISDIYKVTNVFGKELEITHLTKGNFKTTVQYTAVTLCDENVTCSRN